MSAEKIIAKIQAGESVLCEFCGLPFRIEEPYVAPWRISCPNGHQAYLIEWIPDISEEETLDAKSIWLTPVNDLNFEQLKLIKHLCGITSLNLLEMKRLYADEKKHLLLDDINKEQLTEIIEQLVEHKISFTIEDATA